MPQCAEWPAARFRDGLRRDGTIALAASAEVSGYQGATLARLRRDLLESEADDVVPSAQAVDERIILRGARRSCKSPNPELGASRQALGNLTGAKKQDE